MPVRTLLTAAVAAGIFSGILYGIAVLLLPTPAILAAEAIEMGGASYVDTGWNRAFSTLLGAVILATGLALVVTPLLKALGQSVLTGMLLAGVLFAGFTGLQMGLMPLTPPGVEHVAPLGIRQALWLLYLAVFTGTAVLAMAAYRAIRRQALSMPMAILGALSVGLGLALVYAMGQAAPGGTYPSPIPDPLISAFRWRSMASNAILCLALGGSIPALLKRYAA